jgi:arginine/lysine/histidine transporter system substrate-binding protein
MSRLTARLPWLVLTVVVVLASASLSATASPLPAPSDQGAAPTATGAASGKSSPAPGAGPQDDWTRIQSTGRMVIGTSADYPPFEFRTPNFTIDGFDAELMREIARRLGVSVELRDYAFEGLLDGIQLGQLDGAIAAISVTDERSQQVSFSRIYHVGQDAVLAPADYSGEQITTADKLADNRVGVQEGSVYETEMQQVLVDTGLTKPANVVAYADIRDAVAALQAKTIDFVVMDAAPAATIAQSGQGKLAGGGLTRQQFAIALPMNSPTLLVQVNRVLNDLFASGYIAKLEQKYLGTSGGVPAAPTPTPTPAPCVNSMKWVADLNYDDQGMKSPPVLQPAQKFTKTWRVRNSGTCSWQPGFYLDFVSGTRMGGQPVAVGKTVAVGATADLSVNLVAPTAPGTYQGIWQMRDDKGVAFGERIWVGIQVPAPPAPPTATPTPAAPPADMQITQFGVDRNTINYGQCVNVYWQYNGPVAWMALTRNGATLTNDVNARNFWDCPPSPGKMEYQLEATNGVTPRFAWQTVQVQ